METARLSYTSAIDYMGLEIREFIRMRMALISVLEREKAERDAAREE